MSDYIVRAIAADAQIRAFAVTSRELVETARKAHNLSPVASAALGRLMSGGVMMGAMMKGEKDVLTLQVKGDGPIGGLTVTADSMGNVKGYANEPQVMLPPSLVGKLDVGGAVGNGYLRVIKDLGLKEPYIGQTDLQTGEIAEDLTYYFATSEQVPSCVGLGVLMEKDNTVKQAGGFIIQLMPFADDSVITKLEENLRGVDSVTKMFEDGNSPEQILEILLRGFDLEIMETSPVEFYCNCTKDRVEKALISIGKKDLQELIDEGKEIEILANYEPKLHFFTEWWKQLYGESEGKDNVGIFPASLVYSTDLHSMGQYIQEGERIMFETVLDIQNPEKDVTLKEEENNLDGLNYLKGQVLSSVNHKAELGTILAHVDGGVPNIVLEVEKIDAYNIGYLLYFFMLACGTCCYMHGINPFNQPGVESYKRNMFALLGKPGYEDMKKELEARLG